MSGRQLIEPPKHDVFRWLYNIKGVQVMPEYLELSTIIPTVETTLLGYPAIRDAARYNCNDVQFIGGIQTSTYPVADYGTTSGGATARAICPVGYMFGILTLSYEISFDAAGAAAAAGKYIPVALEMLYDGQVYKPYRANHIMSAARRRLFDGDDLSEKFTPQNHISLVPPSALLQLVCWTEDGSNFPANTQLVVRASFFAVPIGGIIPRV